MPLTAERPLPAVETCDVCEWEGPTECRDRATDYITGAEFEIHRCGGCGLETTEPQAPSMDPYYPATYRRYNGLTLAALRMLYVLRVRSWMRRLRKTGRALEVGCGDGWMLRALGNRGWRVLGNERSIDGARAATSLNQVPMFVGELDALRPQPRFDLVILFQVLEHLADPMTALRRSGALLARGGTIVVAVPNCESWQARLFGRAWFHLDVPRHRHHFSPRTLKLALEKVGLRVVRTRFVSFEHDPYGWVQSALNRLGFEQNLMTKLLMGMERRQTGVPVVAGMAVLAAILVVPSVVLSLCSWMTGSGAIVEVWGTKT